MGRFVLIIVFVLGCLSCRQTLPEYQETNRKVQLFPDYNGCVVPVNIAPLNFMVMKRCDEVEVTFRIDGEPVLVCRSEQYIDIPLKKWRALLQQAAAGTGRVSFRVACRIGEKWEAYMPFAFSVVADPVDEWIAYRLIEPGYEGWGRMGLFQRCLSDFREETILDNKLTENNCMNCHHFDRYSPSRFIFHMRGKVNGTMLVDGEQTTWLDGHTPLTPLSLTYPAWHPSGRFIAFSSNMTRQFFHTTSKKQVEVYDVSSDIVIYDTRENRLWTDSLLLARKDCFETYPAWNPAGDRLYFCCADSVPMPDLYRDVFYRICSVAFDAETGKCTGAVDTLFSLPQKSIVFPRISPDGRYLLATVLDYGCFPIWHKEADLIMWNMSTGEQIAHEANSFDAESYHSWSSDGKWVMFSSRRLDGLFTCLWFSHVSEDGRLSKPFLLPQKGKALRDTRLKSYNVPEFISGRVTVSPRKLAAKSKEGAKGIKN